MFLALVAVLAFQPSTAMLRELFEQALAQRTSEYGDADARTAQAARDLGLFLAKQGDLVGAREALAQAVRVDGKTLGPAASQTLADIAELAAVSESSQAELLWRQASKSPDAGVAARSLGALGALHEQAGHRASAANLYRQALAKEEGARGKDSARVAARLNSLSLVVTPAEAIGLLERALRISTARLGVRRIETASIQVNLAGHLLTTGRASRAAQLAQKAASIFEETLGPEHPRTVLSLLLDAHARRATGDKSGAERMYRRILEIEQQSLGPRHPQVLEKARTLIDFLREVGKEQQATELEKQFTAQP